MILSVQDVGFGCPVAACAHQGLFSQVLNLLHIAAFLQLTGNPDRHGFQLPVGYGFLCREKSPGNGPADFVGIEGFQGTASFADGLYLIGHICNSFCFLCCHTGSVSFQYSPVGDGLLCCRTVRDRAERQL